MPVPSRSAYLLPFPLGTAKEPVAIATVALATSAGAPAVAPESVAEQLRWGAGWLEALPWARRSKESRVRCGAGRVVP